MSDTKIMSRPETRERREVKPPVPWNVVLLNDDHHTYEYVIEMLGRVFAQPKEKAFQIAKKVDTDGRAVVLTTHKEHAEFKRDQVRSFGAEIRNGVRLGPLGVVIEPADLGGEGEGGKSA